MYILFQELEALSLRSTFSRIRMRSLVVAMNERTEIAKKNCRTEEERRNVKAMTEKRLVSMGLLLGKSGRVVPSYGYYIVSGEPAPGIMQPKIKCGVFRGVQKGDFVDRRTCEGSAVAQIEEAYAFLLRNIRVGSEIVGTQRRDVYELPLDSIREAICNAVFHRDYLEPSSIYVALYDDRLEILSPGELVKDFSLEDAMNGFSKLRNNALGDALEYMKEVEAWGGGVSRYFTACAASGLPPPTVSEEASFFKVVFWRQTKGAGAFDDASTTPAKTTAGTTSKTTAETTAKTTRETTADERETFTCKGGRCLARCQNLCSKHRQGFVLSWHRVGNRHCICSDNKHTDAASVPVCGHGGFYQSGDPPKPDGCPRCKNPPSVVRNGIQRP